MLKEGYMVYFDGETGAFVAETFKSPFTEGDIEKTWWYKDLQLAQIKAQMLNKDIEDGKIKTFTCKGCGKLFAMTGKEILWFANNNLMIPVRCKSCRSNRKAIKELQGGAESNNSQSPAVSMQVNAFSSIITRLGDD